MKNTQKRLHLLTQKIIGKIGNESKCTFIQRTLYRPCRLEKNTASCQSSDLSPIMYPILKNTNTRCGTKNFSHCAVIRRASAVTPIKSKLWRVPALRKSSRAERMIRTSANCTTPVLISEWKEKGSATMPPRNPSESLRKICFKWDTKKQKSEPMF